MKEVMRREAAWRTSRMEKKRWEAAWRMARREEDKREQFSDKFDKVSRRIFL